MPKVYSLFDLLPIYNPNVDDSQFGNNSKGESKVANDDSINSDDLSFWEGDTKEVALTTYERDPAARRECINHYGAICYICKFNYGERFGQQFAGLIHVHHRVPLNKIRHGYTVNPINDLIPVCPNCHLALHSKEDGYYTPEELIEILGEKKTFHNYSHT